MELAAEDILREIEVMAGALDLLDTRARSGPIPYSDEQLYAEVCAKRQRVLFELEVANVIAPALGWRAKARLVDLGLARLAGYHNAAVALTRYYASRGYARLVAQPAPLRLLEGYVSLDWFRLPSDYAPAGVDPLDWLALCEHNLRAGDPPPVGRLFVKLEGALHQLWFRGEVGTAPHLYRALPG
jgi:hypothetical protein